MHHTSIFLCFVFFNSSIVAFQLLERSTTHRKNIQIRQSIRISKDMSSSTTNIQTLINQAEDLYEKSFGDRELGNTNFNTFCTSAPGRVNLIGEHTDYTDGFVLPLAIGYSTVVYGRGGIMKSTSSTDTRCRIVSTTTNSIVEFQATSSLVPLCKSEAWANYVKGVILQYMSELQSADERFVLDIAIAGDVPLGSGLSSSASLEVATAVFLECILNLNNNPYCIDDSLLYTREAKMERAKKCQKAENVFCNVPCGIMDQFVSSCGSRGKLLLIDCRSLDYKEVSMGGEEGDMPVLVVANSNVKHSLGDSEYPVRVQQCKDATSILSNVNQNIQSLRDATMEDINTASSSAGLEGALLQRARHVVSENKRTVEAANALEKGDWATVGTLMNASHASMKDDYQVSCPEIDILVELAQGYEGVYGSRLTGGGFGGCTVTLVKRDCAQGLIDHLNKEYTAKTGKQCDCFETSPGSGAGLLMA